MKKGFLNHPKTKDLARILDVPPGIAGAIIEGLSHFCQEYVHAGDIGKYTDEQILEQLQIRQATKRWGGLAANTLVDALVETRWLELHEKFRLVVHDWHEHAPDAVHMALARKYLYFWNGSTPKLGRLSKKERGPIEAFYCRNSPSVLCAQTVRTTLPSLPIPSPAEPSLIPVSAQAVRSTKTTEERDRVLKRVERVLILEGFSASDSRQIAEALRDVSPLTERTIESLIAGAIRGLSKDRPVGYAIACMRNAIAGECPPSDGLMRRARDRYRYVESLEIEPAATTAAAAQRSQFNSTISNLFPMPEARP